MTTKILDKNICTLKILLSWRFPRKKKKKTVFLDDFPLCLQGPPRSKAQILFLLSSRRLLFRKKRQININFLLWLKSRWPWDKRLVAPGLTGPKRKHRKYKLFPLVNRRVVPGFSRLSKSLRVQSVCAFLLP